MPEQTSPSPSDGADALDETQLAAAAAAVGALPRTRDQLLPALLAAHHVLGWLPRPAIELVAAHTRIPVSEVYATATAYSELRLEPRVAGQWLVCGGVACDLAGARALHEAQADRTRLTDCQFLCALAPVVVSDHERLHGRVSERLLAALLEGSPA